MISKQIVFFGRALVMACDGRCDKAWGMNGRPRKQLSDDPDDFVYEADSALGVAPGPGQTVVYSEGAHFKPSAEPLHDGESMNKWCARECERSGHFDPNREPIAIPTFEPPRPNLRSRR